MNQCEYCGDLAEYEVIHEGNCMKVCKTCFRDDMVVIQKPTNVQLENSFKRQSVRQVLSRMAGLPSQQSPSIRTNVPVPTLSMLRQSKAESSVKKRLTALKKEQPDQRSLKDSVIPAISSSAANADRNEVEKEEYLDI